MGAGALRGGQGGRMKRGGRTAVRAVLLAAGLGVWSRPAPACLTDFVLDPASPGAFYLFPNWTKTQVAIFDAVYCDSATCTWSLTAYQASLVGLTIMNYGSATGGPT